MEEKVYQIMEDAYNEFKGVNEAQIYASGLIAKYFKQFCEWLNTKTPYDYTEGSDIWMNFQERKDRKTFDELFNYWYDNVRGK